MIEIDKIYNEDCLEGMKRIDDASVDCIITDLPYAVRGTQLFPLSHYGSSTDASLSPMPPSCSLHKVCSRQS